MEMEAVRSSVYRVELDEDAVDAAQAALAEALLGVRRLTAAMSSTFAMLAANPGRFSSARFELERLDGERRSLLERLGELSIEMLVLQEVAPNGATEVTESSDVRPSNANPALESADVEVQPAPLSRDEVIAGLRVDPEVEGRVRARPATDDKGALLSLANHVAIASETPTDLDEEVASLERATTEARVAQWKRMSESAQVRWVTILVAWAKALEAEASVRSDGATRVATAFRRLRVFSKYDSPGYIHGFARDAVPEGESWRADAVELLAGLRGRPRPAPVPRPKVLRDEAEEEEVRDARVPDEWPYFSRVRGKSVAMLGGEVREERRIALAEAFQCGTFEWIPHNRPRLLRSLTERAAQGTVDVVLVNKFVAHKETASLERVSTVPVINVRAGYGVTAVRRALEGYFSSR